MPVAFESIGSIAYATRTNTTVPAPAGIQNGDLLVAIMISGGNPEAPDFTAASGFALIPGTWPMETTVASFNVEMRVYHKFASGESGDYTFTNASGSTAGAVLRISGADATTPFAPDPTMNTGTAADTAFTSITTTVDGALIIAAAADWADTANNLTPPAGSTPTFTERYDGVVMYIATGNLATAGATGAKTMANNATTGGWLASLIAVNPSAGTYVGSGAAATAASGNVTPALPSNLETDDALILDITALDNVDCSVAVSGGSGNAWTRKGAQNNGTGLRKEVWWKRRGASDTDTAAAVTHTAGSKIGARVHAFRVAGTSDPFEAFTFETTAAAATGDFPDITTLSADATLLYGLGYGEDFSVGPSITAAQGLTLAEIDETEVT